MAGESAQRSAAPGVVAAVLAVAALVFAAQAARVETSVDFYQFWGVGAARAHAAEPLPTPWRSVEATRAALDARLAADPDPRVRRVHAQRMRSFEPFGSPLLYAVFALAPADYATAATAFSALQLAAFATAVLALGSLCGRGAVLSLLALAALALGYRPFGDDLYTGNLNAIQLLGLVLVVAAIARGAPAAALAGLTALLLLKPNLVIVGAALAACVVLRHDRATTVRAFAAAAGVGGILVAASSLYFSSARSWLDWARFAFVSDPRRLGDYAVARGNVSTPRLAFEQLGLDPLLAAAAVALLLGLAFVAGAVSNGRSPRRALGAVLRDPLAAASWSVVVTLALLPLLWFHYFVLALLPLAWLGLAPGRAARVRLLALAALLLYSGVYLRPALSAGLYPYLAPLWAVAWVLPWSALLIQQREAPDG